MVKKKKTITPPDSPAFSDKLPTVVAIDPNDPQEITPTVGDVFTIEYNGEQRTLKFVRGKEFDGTEPYCKQCALDDGKCSIDSDNLCHRINCEAHDVVAKEFVHSPDGDYFVEKQKTNDAAPPELPLVDDDGTLDAVPLVDESDVSDAEKRRRWEAALLEYEKKAREYEFKEADYKVKARQCANRAKILRGKLTEILVKGSENYVSETPLFDIMEAEEENEE